jgi:hypothetical protein
LAVPRSMAISCVKKLKRPMLFGGEIEMKLMPAKL